MPELPDITVYLEALEARVLGHALERADIVGISLLRTVDPPVSDVFGRKVVKLRRVGKRIAFGFDNGLWMVLHLMIAGRLHWHPAFKKPDGRRMLASFLFDSGCLTLTEAGTRKRAALHMISGEEGLVELDAGGVDVMAATLEQFARVLRSENHTLKRALTDPGLFSGIGNAYSDEILHEARLSPVAMTSRLTDAQVAALHEAVQKTLAEWIVRLRKGAKGKFPEKVTAFREDMAAHGRFGLPCPRCGEKIQRIRYADRETNYCAKCQTDGKLLADRGLSRLLKQDWPRTLEEMEERRQSMLH
jgi:formamidopyrimidine-DNA glycosylase